MPTKEEIREGIKQSITFCPKEKPVWCKTYGNKTWAECLDCMVDNVIKYLHENGVVIKSEKELPRNPYLHLYGQDPEAHRISAYNHSQQDMLDADYTATGSLI